MNYFGINELFDSNMSCPSRLKSCTRHSMKAFPLSLLVFLRPQRSVGIYRPTVYDSEENGTDERRKSWWNSSERGIGNIVLLNNNFQHWSSILYFLKSRFWNTSNRPGFKSSPTHTDCLLLGKPFHISELSFPILKQWFPSTFVGFCGESIR